MPTREWNSTTGRWVNTGGIPRDTAGRGGQARGSLGPVGPMGRKGPWGDTRPTMPPAYSDALKRLGDQEGARRKMLQDAWNAYHPAPTPPSPEEVAMQRAEAARAAYDQKFRSAMDAQRANIDVMLRQSMTDIGARRAEATKLAGLRPGEINTLYNEATPAIDKANTAAKNDLLAAGASAPTAAQNAGIDAMKAAIESSRAASLADQPYLNAGVNTLFNNQAGMANAIAQDQRGRIAEQEAQHASQMAGLAYEQEAAGMSELDIFKEKMRLEEGAQRRQSQRETSTLLAATKPGTRQWWEAYSAHNPDAAKKMAGNFDLGPKKLKRLRDNWQESKKDLAPSLVSFLRFRYDLP